MLSLETLQLCRVVVGQLHLDVNAADFAETATAVAQAKEELELAIVDAADAADAADSRVAFVAANGNDPQ